MKLFKRIIKELIPYIFIIIFVLLLKTYVMTPIQVNGDSMDPTLKDGDFMILNKLGYRLGSINRFDIVVIDKDDSYIIKRIIGLNCIKIGKRLPLKRTDINARTLIY